MTRPAILEMSKILLGPEPTDTWKAATPHEFTPSAMTTSTFDYATFVGWTAVDIGAVVEPTSGPCKGMRRMVTAMNGALGRATVNPPWPTDPSDGSIEPTLRAWVPGEALVLARAPGSSITVVARSGADGPNAWGVPARVEVAGTWADDAAAGTNLADRFALVGIAGANENRTARIINQSTGAAPSNMTLTIDPCTGWLAGDIGDMYQIRKEAQAVAGLPIPPTSRPVLESEVSGKGTMMREPHVLGPARPSGPYSLSFYLRRAHAAATPAAACRGPSTIGDILKTIGTVTTPLNSACAAGSTAAILKVAVADIAQMIPGALIMVDGEVTRINTVTDNNPADADVAVSPSLKAAPATGTVIRQGWNWTPKTAIDASILVDVFLRGTSDSLYSQRRQVTGWKPSWKFDGVQPNAIPQIVFEGPFAGIWRDGLSYGKIASTSSLPGKFPTPDHRGTISTYWSRCVLDSTRLANPVSWSLDLGLSVAQKEALDGPFSLDGVHLDDRKTVGTLVTHLQDFDGVNRYEREQEFQLLYQAGNTQGDCFAWCVPTAQFTEAQEAWEGSRGRQPLPFAVNDPKATRWYFPGGGGSTPTGLPLPDVILTWF